MSSTDFIPATATADADYRRACTNANDVYQNTMINASKAHFAAINVPRGIKSVGVYFESASASADTAFDVAQESASEVYDRAITAARVALIASTEAK